MQIRLLILKLRLFKFDRTKIKQIDQLKIKLIQIILIKFRYNFIQNNFDTSLMKVYFTIAYIY